MQGQSASMQKTQEGREQRLSQAQKILDRLQQYYDNGGKTGPAVAAKFELTDNTPFTQLFEQWVENETDPVLQNIVQMIEKEYVEFRKDITGAAFTPQEEQSYKRFFFDPRLTSAVNLGRMKSNVGIAQNIATKGYAIAGGFSTDNPEFIQKVLGPQFTYDRALEEDSDEGVTAKGLSGKPTVSKEAQDYTDRLLENLNETEKE